MLPALPYILGAYGLASLVTFIAFYRDKRAAIIGSWRTPERTLHLLELAGGFPGAFAAMFLIRHKNRKWTFVAITVLIAIAHLAAWSSYFWKR